MFRDMAARQQQHWQQYRVFVQEEAVFVLRRQQEIAQRRQQEEAEFAQRRLRGDDPDEQ